MLNDAEQLKLDLNTMMENALDVSRTLVNELDAKVSMVESVEKDEETAKPATVSPTKGGLRVYELARELNINSKELLGILDEHGYKYRSHMNVLDYDVAENIKKVFYERESSSLEIAGSEDIAEINNYFSLEEIKKAHPYLAVSILKEQGYSIKEIAKLLGRGQGEISLILNLSKKAKAL